MAFRHEVKGFLQGFKTGSEAMENASKGYYYGASGDKINKENQGGWENSPQRQDIENQRQQEAIRTGTAYTPPRRVPQGGVLGGLMNTIGLGRSTFPSPVAARTATGSPMPVMTPQGVMAPAEAQATPNVFTPPDLSGTGARYAGGGVIGDDADPDDYDGDGYPDTDLVFPETVEQTRARSVQGGGGRRSGRRPGNRSGSVDDIVAPGTTEAPRSVIDTTPQGPGAPTNLAPAPWSAGPDDYAKALHAGLRFAATNFNQTQGAIPQSPDPNKPQGSQALAQGAGAMPKEEMKAVNAVVNERPGVPARDEIWGIRTLEAMYRYHMMQGDSAMASKVAFELMQYSGIVAAKLGSKALDEINARNYPGAVQATVSALNVVPDGYRYEARDDGKVDQIDVRTGKVKETHDITPSSVFNVALGLSNKSLYFKLLQQRVHDTVFAGAKDDEDKALDKEKKVADIEHSRAATAKLKQGPAGPVGLTPEQQRQVDNLPNLAPAPENLPNPPAGDGGGTSPAPPVPPQGSYEGDNRYLESPPDLKSNDDDVQVAQAGSRPDVGPMGYGIDDARTLPKVNLTPTGDRAFTGPEPAPGNFQQDATTGVSQNAYADPKARADEAVTGRVRVVDPDTGEVEQVLNPYDKVTRSGPNIVPASRPERPRPFDKPDPYVAPRGLLPDDLEKMEEIRYNIAHALTVWPDAKQRTAMLGQYKKMLADWQKVDAVRQQRYQEWDRNEQRREDKYKVDETHRMDTVDKANRDRDQKQLEEAINAKGSTSGTLRADINASVGKLATAYKDKADANKPDPVTKERPDPYEHTVLGDGSIDTLAFGDMAETIAKTNNMSGDMAVNTLDSLLSAGRTPQARGYRPIKYDVQNNIVVELPSGDRVHLAETTWDQVTALAARRTQARVLRERQAAEQKSLMLRINRTGPPDTPNMRGTGPGGKWSPQDTRDYGIQPPMMPPF